MYDIKPATDDEKALSKLLADFCRNNARLPHMQSEKECAETSADEKILSFVRRVGGAKEWRKETQARLRLTMRLCFALNVEENLSDFLQSIVNMIHADSMALVFTDAKKCAVAYYTYESSVSVVPDLLRVPDEAIEAMLFAEKECDASDQKPVPTDQNISKVCKRYGLTYMGFTMFVEESTLRAFRF